jgi:hypothetical protein
MELSEIDDALRKERPVRLTPAINDAVIGEHACLARIDETGRPRMARPNPVIGARLSSLPAERGALGAALLRGRAAAAPGSESHN